MAVLTIPNTFVAGTSALASEVNNNFSAIVTWSEHLDQSNLNNFTGPLNFVIAGGNAITIQNNGDDESIFITQTDALDPDKAVIRINDIYTQTAADAAELKMTLAAGATIPAIHVIHGAADTLKLTKDYLRLEALLKPPIKTTAERDAISSPETGSILYDSTANQVSVKRSDAWTPIGPPIGSVQMFAGSVAPEGWLLCNGATLDSIANPKYAALFVIISTTYGGTGANSFKVPDCRGVFVRGAGSQTIGAETYTATLGTAQNDATAVNGLVTPSAGSHNHTGSTGSTAISYTGKAVGSDIVFNPAAGNAANVSITIALAGSDHTHSISTDGSHTHTLTGDSETRPANVALTYIIKY